MRVDAAALQSFYAGPLGAVAQRMVLRRLEAVWPHCTGLDVLGLGYAAPFLAPYRDEARRLVLAMPTGQGGHGWPGAPAANSAAIVDENRLPFVEALFDRILIVHALEEAANPRQMLREIWRVAAPEARIVVIAANRPGLWARSEATPFGSGRPYSRRQLAALISDCMYTPSASAWALYTPPWRWALDFADSLERVGELILPGFGGLVMMEAQKRLIATPGASAVEVRAPAAAVQSAPNPAVALNGLVKT